jgi:hypothetical protein
MSTRSRAFGIGGGPSGEKIFVYEWQRTRSKRVAQNAQYPTNIYWANENATH